MRCCCASLRRHVLTMRAQVFVRRIAPANSLDSLLPKGSARGCFLHHITVLLVIYYWLFSLLQDLQDH